MTAVGCHEIGKGRRRARLGTSMIRQYSRWFRVRTSTPYDLGAAITAQGIAPGNMPNRGDSYFEPQTGYTDALAFCSEIIAQEQQEDDPQCFLVECQYTSDDQTLLLENSGDPNDDQAEFSFTNELVQRFATEDVDGTLIANSAGDIYSAISQPYYRLVITITRNETSFNDTLAAELMGTYNNAPWYSYDEAQVFLQEYSASGPKYRNGIEYWPHVYVLKIDTVYGWKDTLLLDSGLQSLGPATGAKQSLGPIFINGQPTSVPLLLNGNGQYPADVNGRYNPVGGFKPVYNTFHLVSPGDLDQLQLPIWS